MLPPDEEKSSNITEPLPKPPNILRINWGYEITFKAESVSFFSNFSSWAHLFMIAILKNKFSKSYQVSSHIPTKSYIIKSAAASLDRLFGNITYISTHNKKDHENEGTKQEIIFLQTSPN